VPQEEAIDKDGEEKRQAHEAEDKHRREEIESPQPRPTNLAYATEKSLKDLGDDPPPRAKTVWRNQVKAVREALNGKPISSGQSATETLMQVRRTRLPSKPTRLLARRRGGAEAAGPEASATLGDSGAP